MTKKLFSLKVVDSRILIKFNRISIIIDSILIFNYIFKIKNHSKQTCLATR